MNLLKRLIHHTATAAMFKICSWFKITKSLSFIIYILFCLGVPESLRYSILCMNFFSEKVKKLQVLGVCGEGRVSNKERSPSCLLTGAWGNSSSREDAGAVWIPRQDRKDLSPALMTCPQVLSKAERGVCGDAREPPHPHLWSILSMSITAYGKHWVMATVLVKFKGLLWNAASALMGGAHGMLK